MQKTPWHLIIAVLAFIVAGPVNTAHAFSTYLSAFSSTYAAAPTAIKTCNLCHPNGNTLQFTPYATAYLSSGYNFAAIENLDSDADGFINIVEINAGTFPGDAASKPAATDTIPPTVTINAPTAGTLYINAASLDFAVSDGTITVYVDGVAKGLQSGDVISGLSNGPHTVRVESTDTAGNVGSSEVSFTVDVEPIFSAAIADSNGNGKAEVVSLLRNYNSGGFVAYIKDGLTKALIRTVNFGSAYLPVGFCALADLNANGSQELAMLGVTAAGRVAAVIRDSSTGAVVKTLSFPQAYYPVSIAEVPDFSGNGKNELAVLGISGTGKVAVVVKDIDSGEILSAVGFPSTHVPMALAVVGDVSGNSVSELAVLSVSANENRIFLKDAATKAAVKYLAYPSTMTPVAFSTAPDVNGNGADELVIIGANAAGQYYAQLKDVFTGFIVNNLALAPKSSIPQGAVVINDLNANSTFEFGAIGLSATGAVSINLRDTSTGSSAGNIPFPARQMGVVPPPPVDGKALYDSRCAACHSVNSYDASGSPDLAAKGGLVAGKFATAHNGIVLTSAEQTALAAFLNQYTAPPPPVSGQSVYDASCAGCHSVNGYDASGAPDLAAKGGVIASKFAVSHNGITLTSAQQTAVATFLDQYTAPPTGGSCTSCHAQPPAGTTSPNRAGAHQVHSALAGVGSDCSVCHSPNPSHNGVIDRGIATVFNAKSGAAVFNTNQTCSTVSCHGGNVTPNWLTGTINVNTQCTSCHSSGTTQYNSYNSGRHSRHSGELCTDCHSTTKLATGHFANLTTTTMEGPASGTIGGTGTQVGSYNTSTKTCSNISCHGSKSW